MRICIPTLEGDGLNGLPYTHLGSAHSFVLHDLASGETRIIHNQNEHHEHGRCHPLKALEGEAVDVVLVGGIGARALARLQAAGMRVFQAQERTIRENIEAFQQDELTEFTSEIACRRHSQGGGQGETPSIWNRPARLHLNCHHSSPLGPSP